MSERIVLCLTLCICSILSVSSSTIFTLHEFTEYISDPEHSDRVREAEEINLLSDVLIKAEKDALTFELPEDAYKHRAKNDDVSDVGEFDFVIIGAGSAGTVIANRLSEIPQWNILLLEAGEFADTLLDIPNTYFTSQFTDYNWGFFSTPQETSCLGMVDQRCPMSRGKGVGGSSLLNALVYSRGSSIDFDRWGELVNDSRWSYDNVLDYFRKSEDYHHRDVTAPVDERSHGKNGYLNVEYHLPRSVQVDAFLRAHEELGLPIADYNSGTGLGASPMQTNTKNGRRHHGGRAFIDPVLKRRNLQILENSYVTKILIDKDTKIAHGVSFTRDGKNHVVTAKNEVVLCAGAISSPQILMLSGVGPREHLESNDIDVIEDLEVGSAMKDHATFYGLNFGSNATESWATLKEKAKQFLEGIGPLTIPGNFQLLGFYESQFTKGTGLPDIEFMLLPANATQPLSKRAFSLTDETYEDVWGHVNWSQNFVFYIIALHSMSEGTVRLKSGDPFDYPIIDTNFLSDPEDRDIRTLYEGIQLAINLTNTGAMQEIGAELQGVPLRACKQHEYLSEEYWYCAIRQMGMNIYHPIATCPMGDFPEEGHVVDAQLRVYGVRNLRVADASVIPFTLSGHPHAVVVMIGEQVSDILKEEYL